MAIKKSFFLYLAFFVICLFFSFISTSYDYDFFARIIVGQRFLVSGILPYEDFLSYTPTHPWFDHEWGSGVVFYAVLKFLKPIGLLFLQAVLAFGTVFFIIKSQKLQRKYLPISLAFMSIFIFLFSKLNPTIIRCQMFSFFFFAVFIYLLEDYKKNSASNKIWWILPLTIVWNNLHGGIVSGLGIAFLYMICMFFTRQNWKKLAGVLSLSSLSLIINPYGYKYLKFLFSASTMNREFINEWWSVLDKSNISYYGPVVLVILIIFSISLFISFKNKKFDYTKILVLLVTIFLGIAHVKLISLALIATFALCYQDVIKFCAKLKHYLKPIEKSFRYIVVFLIILLPLLSPNTPRVDFTRIPFLETEFLKINDIKGNLLVPFGYGSYISYKLYPNNLIFMDGRYEEVYDNSLFMELKDFSLGKDGWKDFLTKYDTQIVMVEKFYKVSEFLKLDNSWTLVYEGPLCTIFVHNENLKKEYKKPEVSRAYYQKTVFETESF